MFMVNVHVSIEGIALHGFLRMPCAKLALFRLEALLAPWIGTAAVAERLP